MVVIVMGVSGCGKTTVGRLLAEQIHGEFLDADDFHPPENVAKMRSGQPLDDADRTLWLDRLRTEIATRLTAGRTLVLACSALRETYRSRLRHAGEPVVFAYLRGDIETIRRRLGARRDHYMPPSLLASQFATLEEPRDAIIVPIELSPAEAAQRITSALASTGLT